ncbi:hypothetical protein [Myxococcus sp. RHSTA-1-4]|uniref:hypothetical protein n=1 Tax=Myxococcus sp. RHSTA-1-4 TaxID=2874601 RepID=UPI001CC0C88F|nr:hypothetical protein [Myxococcus sp. RHSTA-1-4]MBZ4422790.1 hypothetical protein [Myxococcus sp. RHSTA-1-4]
MTSSLQEAVGNEAGWELRLFTEGVGAKELSLSSRDYHAEVEATLPGGLEGGSYSMAIEGISPAHYEQVSAMMRGGQPVYADLSLSWRDTGSPLGMLSSLAGLTGSPGVGSSVPGTDAQRPVAVLRVTRFSRRMGARRYEAVLEGHERVYDALLARLPVLEKGTDSLDAAAKVAKALHKAEKVRIHALPAVRAAAGAPPQWHSPEGTGVSALLQLAARLEEESGRYGRGMLLIREGTLHIGPGRPIPLEGGPAPVLDFSSGLIQAEVSGTRSTDPQGAPPGGLRAPPPTRATYQLLLKGRPDLKPGDVVQVSLPAEDAAEPAGLGALGAVVDVARAAGVGAPAAAPPVSIYVTGVQHRLSRTAGFTTTVAGVDRIAPGREWDTPTPVRSPVPHGGDPRASPDGRVMSALREVVRGGAREPLGVGEVRASHVEGRAEPPAQTVSVWKGLAPGDGLPRQARRLPVDREERPLLAGVPYLTPFAWGRCGLVLPRYPGTRVVLGHHLGREDDPVDLGAVWESGHAPDSRPGDWWLILPADVPPSRRQTLPAGQQPAEPSGLATNDLIDADGNRVIEVGRLTVRIGETLLKGPGTRPESAGDSVTIQHAEGSRIVIKQNGDIVIHSEGALSLAAKTTLTLEADDVKVKVKNAMDVGDRT